MNLRQSLISIGRRILEDGLVAGTWGNLSVWDPDKNGFWITPSGMDYLSLKEDDLVLLDRNGKIIAGYRKPSSEYLLHMTVYNRRTDVAAVVHTHSIYATAHAVARISIPPIVEDLIQIVGGAVNTAKYELPGSENLAKKTVETLSDKNAALLANHGLVGVGRNLEEAYKVCMVVEKAAHIHYVSRMLGSPISLTDDDVQAMRSNFLLHYGQKP